jgi:hypothetical protein
LRFKGQSRPSTQEAVRRTIEIKFGYCDILVLFCTRSVLVLALVLVLILDKGRHFREQNALPAKNAGFPEREITDESGSMLGFRRRAECGGPFSFSFGKRGRTARFGGLVGKD